MNNNLAVALRRAEIISPAQEQEVIQKIKAREPMFPRLYLP